MTGAADLRDALPKPPLGDLGEEQIDRAVAADHAAELLAGGTLTGLNHQQLTAALERAWLLYLQGNAIGERLKQQKAISENWARRGRTVAAAALARQRKARPIRYGDRALVQALLAIWRAGGRKPGISYGSGVRKMGYDGRSTNEHDGPLQRFVIGFLRKIDPERRHPPPSRHIYAAAIRRLT